GSLPQLQLMLFLNHSSFIAYTIPPPYLHRYRSLDMGVKLIILQFKILKFKIENIFYFRIYFHRRQWFWFSAQLQFGLLKMVAVYMSIAQSMHKITHFHVTYLSHHHG